jgi:catalase
VKSVSRLLAAIVLLGTATSVTAQSFNQELGRYRVAKYECEEAFRRATQVNCGQACQTAATERRTRCLATAEQRYGEALRRALRIRR